MFSHKGHFFLIMFAFLMLACEHSLSVSMIWTKVVVCLHHLQKPSTWVTPAKHLFFFFSLTSFLFFSFFAFFLNIPFFFSLQSSAGQHFWSWLSLVLGLSLVITGDQQLSLFSSASHSQSSAKVSSYSTALCEAWGSKSGHMCLCQGLP